MQSQINDLNASRHQLYYELIHNLVVETTRLGIEVKNLRMRVESLDARVDFSERRARALEGAVMYRPHVEDEREAPRPARSSPPPDAESCPPTGSAGSSRSVELLAARAAPGTRSGPAPARRGKRRSAQQAPPPPARPAWRRARQRRHGLPGGSPQGSDDPLRRADARSRPTNRPRRASDPAIGRRRTPGLRCLDRLRARRGRRRAVKLAVVVQRYGQAINGGAELHARYIAEHLARHAEVDVLTTYAQRLRHLA